MIFLNYLFLGLKGIALGAASIMPGVSGATLSIIFRLYDQLIESINNLFTDMKKSVLFLLPVGLGMVIGVLGFGSIIDFFITNFSLQASSFIAGLMAGSIPFIHSQAVSQVTSGKGKYYGIAVAAAITIIIITLFAPQADPREVYGLNFGMIMLLFICGILVAGTMVIPGVSGAMVLILFGFYTLAMHTISDILSFLRNPSDFELLRSILITVVPLGLGAVIGIFATSKLISILLEKYNSATFFAILGILIGTIFAIFNDAETYQSYDRLSVGVVIFSIIAAFAGVAVSLALGNKK